MADQCTATSKQTGQRCKQRPTPGATVCRFHGGKAKQVQAKAAERLQEQAAAAAVARLNGRRDIHPLDALEELVHTQAGIVAYWAHRVDELDEDDLTWGITQHREGSGPEGPVDVETREAKPNIAYVLWQEARDRLARYSTDALKAGVDERRVALAERQGTAVAAALRGIVDDQWEAMRKWIPAERVDEALSDWNASLAVSAPRHLRAIAGGGAS